jgi:ABC-type ATPase with predicted acetyltransferase domain
MTLVDWVALAMLWWKGGGRPAIVRWLTECRDADRMGAERHASLAARGRLARARAAAQGALEAAHAGGITAVP